MSSRSVVVSSSWPIVVLVCPPIFEASWVADLDTSFGEIFARREPFALVTDTTAIESIPGARERKVLSEWAGRPDQLALQKRFNVGSSTIVKNAVMRGTLQALYWLWTPPAPQHAARDFDEAWTWCVAILQKRAIDLPAPAALRRTAERDMARLHAQQASRAPL